MKAKLYGTPPSHPSHAARLMLEHKGMEHEVVWLLPGMWPALLRTRGFRGSTVPALKLDGRKIQHSRAISRALDQAQPEPPLFPTDPEQRLKVEEAEKWGEEVFQNVPRRIVRWLASNKPEVRKLMAIEAKLPAPGLVGAANAPVARFFARKADATDERVQKTIALLPALLDHADKLIADGVIGGRERNAADFQILTTVRGLMHLGDIAPAVEGRPCAKAAAQLMPDFPGDLPAGLLPQEWLAPLSPQAAEPAPTG